MAANAGESLLAVAGQALAPVFAPLGFGDWRAATALMTGLLAKETVLSTLGVLLGGDLTGVPNLFTLANMTTNKSQAKETINDQTQSLFATLQLGYKNMVFLDVTARNDWVTALANTSKTSMFYPSVGLSAVLTDIFKVDSRVPVSYTHLRAHET